MDKEDKLDKEDIYLILFIMIVFLIFITVPRYIDLMNDPPLTREVKMNMEFGRVVEVRLIPEAHFLRVSVNLEIVGLKSLLGTAEVPFSNKQLGEHALIDGFRTMEVAEKHYPDIKTVQIRVTTDDPDRSRIVQLQTHTRSSVYDWKNETPSGDLEAYSKEKFDRVTWYVDTSIHG